MLKIGILISSLIFSRATAAEDFAKIASSAIDYSEWKVTDETRVLRHSQEWNWTVFRSTKNEDLLTLARWEKPCLLDAAGTHDNALEFAPSGFRYWVDPKTEYRTSSVKMNKVTFRVVVSGKPMHEVVALAYVNVNEGEMLDPLMANGFIAVLGEQTYYVQHSSKRPSRDTIAREIMDRLLQVCHNSALKPPTK